MPRAEGQPVNVALFPSAFFPHFGGVEELTRQLALSLKSKGHEVLIMTNQWPRSLSNTDIVSGLDVMRYPFRTYEGSAKQRLVCLLTKSKIQRSLESVLSRHQIDVIHVQCLSSNTWYAVSAGKRLGIPVVLTAQGELTMDAGEIYKRPTVVNKNLKYYLETADWVTGCSRRTLDDVFHHVGMPVKANASVVWNGVDTREFVVALPYVHERPYILAIGRAVPQKGFDVLLHALSILGVAAPDLLVVGAGAEMTNLQTMCSEFGLDKRVTFYGKADRSQVPSLFRGARYVVLPSVADEGLPVVTAEASAAGKAIIATDVGGVTDIVIDRTTGLVIPRNDVHALADAIRTYESYPNMVELHARDNLARSQQFDWSVLTDQYVDVYTRVLR
jgi:glycogen(starch) synthase